MPGNIQDISPSEYANWPARNTVDPVRRTWMPIHAMVLLAASTVMVSIRVWLRSRSLAGRFGLDDALIVAAWLFNAGLSSVAVVQTTRFELDRHTWDVSTTNYVGAAFCGWLAQLMFHISSCSTKCSVLLFYRRTFREVGHYRGWLNASYAALGITIGYTIGTFVAYFCICTPLQAYWESYDLAHSAEYRCLSGQAISLGIGLGSVFTDVIAVFLPYLVLRRYHLNVGQSRRIGLHLIFALGLLVAAAGCVRTYFLWELTHNVDTSWTGFDLFVWSLVECHLAIMVASVPSARACYRIYLVDHQERTQINEEVETNRLGSVAEVSEFVPDDEPQSSCGMSLRRKEVWSIGSGESPRD